MAPPKAAKGPTPPAVRELEKLFAPALRSNAPRARQVRTDDPYLRLLRVIKAIAGADELGQCIDAYCRLFDPATKQPTLDAKVNGRLIGFNLFIMAAKLAGPLNGLERRIKELKAAKPLAKDDGQPRYLIWARRWHNLEPDEQNRVLEALKQRPRYLISHLIDYYGPAAGEPAPTMAELLVFNRWSDNDRARFKAATDAWYLPYSSAIHSRPDPMSEAIAKVLKGAEIFNEWLDREMYSPLDFFRLLRFAREQGAGNIWDFWDEVYLEIVARGHWKALRQWGVTGVAKGMFAGDDLSFIHLGLAIDHSDQARQLLKLRLRTHEALKLIKKLPESLKPDAKMQASESEGRRTLEVAARYMGAELQNEIELKALTEKMDREWKKDPAWLLNRRLLTYGQREVDKDSFWINQQVGELFTITWIDEDRWTAYFEHHAMPGAVFKGNSYVVRDLNRHAMYQALAKNAAALAGFLMAYLEVLGWVVDIISAGTAATFRRALWHFAKEQIEAKVIQMGVESLNIDNPWLKSAAYLAAGGIRVPKKKPKAVPSIDVEAPHAHLPDQPASGAKAAEKSRIEATADPLGSGTGVPSAPSPPKPIASNPAARPQPGAPAPTAPDLPVQRPKGDLPDRPPSGARPKRAADAPTPEAKPRPSDAELRMQKVQERNRTRAEKEAEKKMKEMAEAEAQAEAKVASGQAGQGQARVIEMGGKKSQGSTTPTTGHVSPDRARGTQGGKPKAAERATPPKAPDPSAPKPPKGGAPPKPPEPPKPRIESIYYRGGILDDANDPILQPMTRNGFQFELVSGKTGHSGGWAFQRWFSKSDKELKIVSPSGIEVHVDVPAVSSPNSRTLILGETKATFVGDISKSGHLRFEGDKAEQLARQVAVASEAKGAMTIEVICSAPKLPGGGQFLGGPELYLTMANNTVAMELLARYPDHIRQFLRQSGKKVPKQLSINDAQKVVDKLMSVSVLDFGYVKGAKK